MLKVYICRVKFRADGDDRSARYATLVANEFEAEEHVGRFAADNKIENFRIVNTEEATPEEAASLLLSAGMVKLLN